MLTEPWVRDVPGGLPVAQHAGGVEVLDHDRR
jgi:hypothetical protein